MKTTKTNKTNNTTNNTTKKEIKNTMKTLSNNQTKKDYSITLQNTIKKVSNEEIVLNEKSNKQLFNEVIEMFKPNEKDLSDETHCHYNPNAIINVFMKQSTYIKYGIKELKLKNVIVETLKRDGYRYWISIDNMNDLIKLLTHLVNKGYTFKAQ